MKHADECREAIHLHCPNPALALEFINFLDPDGEDKVWQRFEKPTDVIPTLEAWLGGEDPAPVSPRTSGSLSSLRDRLATPGGLKIPSALHRTRAWLAEPSTRQELEKMTSVEAAESALNRLARELEA